MFKVKSKTILIVILLMAITLFIVNPKVCMEATLQGVRVWGLNVVPALFPFLPIFTSFSVHGGFCSL
jgi:carbon starvation protein CstA